MNETVDATMLIKDRCVLNKGSNMPDDDKGLRKNKQIKIAELKLQSLRDRGATGARV